VRRSEKVRKINRTRPRKGPKSKLNTARIQHNIIYLYIYICICIIRGRNKRVVCTHITYAARYICSMGATASVGEAEKKRKISRASRGRVLAADAATADAARSIDWPVSIRWSGTPRPTTAPLANPTSSAAAGQCHGPPAHPPHRARNTPLAPASVRNAFTTTDHNNIIIITIIN